MHWICLPPQQSGLCEIHETRVFLSVGRAILQLLLNLSDSPAASLQPHLEVKNYLSRRAHPPSSRTAFIVGALVDFFWTGVPREQQVGSIQGVTGPDRSRLAAG